MSRLFRVHNLQSSAGFFARDERAKKFPSRRHLPIVVSKGLKGSMKMKTPLVQELSADQYKKHLEGGIIGLLF